MRVPMEKVPLADRRRAARALESLLGLGSRRQRSAARFATEAAEVFRPDLDVVAYWEFEIEGLHTSMPMPEGEAKDYDKGFLLVATGAHDVPVPHFSLDLAPPSRRLEQFGQEVHRLVKLDSLCYAAEDRDGRLIGHVGTMPPRLEGVPELLPKRLPAGWATTLPKLQEADQERREDGERAGRYRLRRSREVRPFEKVGEWESWEDARSGYAKAYRLHLEALAQRAAHPWQVEALTEKFGQGIHSGETLTVPLLAEGDYEVSGPGAEFVEVSLNPQPLPPRLLLTPRAGLEHEDLSFDVHFRYGSESETLNFFIVPEGAPTTIAPAPSPLGPTFGGK